MLEINHRKFAALLFDWIIALIIVSLVILFWLTQPILPTFFKDSSQTSELVEIELEQHVKQLTHNFSPRTKSHDFLGVTAKYIHDNFDTLGHAYYQKIERLSGNYNNVILELGERSEEVIVIGAHYDAENDSLDTEGNASGISSLLALARLLSNNETKLPIKVILVAYPLSHEEDYKRSGSYIHAKSLKASRINVRVMFSLDSVGLFNSEKESQSYPYKFMKLIYPSRGDYVNLSARLQDTAIVRSTKKSLGKSTGLSIFSQNLPERFNYNHSNNHKSYWDNGFPAILISDTKDFRTVQNQSAGVSQRLDYQKMAQLVEGLFTTVLETKSVNAYTAEIVGKQKEALSILPDS